MSIYLQCTVDPKKVNYLSTKCQVRDILETTKCRRKAICQFVPTRDSPFTEFKDVPICHVHLKELRDREPHTGSYVIRQAVELDQ